MKRFIFLIMFSLSFVYCSYAATKILFKPFSSISKTDENISYLEKNIPENIISYLEKADVKNAGSYMLIPDMEGAEYPLSSTTLDDLQLRYKEKFLIVGKVELTESNYMIELSIYDIRKLQILYTRSLTSVGYDLYPLIQDVSMSIKDFLVTFQETQKSGRVRPLNALLFNVELGYPIPVADYLSIQLGIISTTIVLKYEFLQRINKILYTGFRIEAGVGYSFFINQQVKVESYFNEVMMPFNVNYVLRASKNYMTMGLGFSNVFHTFIQPDYYKNNVIVFSYAPVFKFMMGYGISPFKDERHQIGINTEYQIIFYPGVLNNELFPKNQFLVSLFYACKFEVKNEK
ncbi:MAG: hypothetical protein A2355_16000 [Spirochaetes bacterium RIFOXYB1_FULL_32_8]|nr:MAG: hypothetical protein A2355_16000 [Spirochaetes bacterium RIFOXYB1_FULL_32_8]